MNERVQKKLAQIKEYAENINAHIECILQDIEDVETSEDMFIIDQGFERIIRDARVAIDIVRETEDEFEEDEG